jgi:hypothetical protein
MVLQTPLMFKPVHSDAIKPVASAVGTGGSTAFFTFTVAIPYAPTPHPSNK